MTDRRALEPREHAPDARIFRLTDAWFEAHRALEATASRDEERYERLSSQYAETLRELLGTVPASAAGLEAKAAVLAAQIRLTCPPCPGCLRITRELEAEPPVGPDLLGHIDLYNLLWYLRRDIAALARKEQRDSGRSRSGR